MGGSEEVGSRIFSFEKCEFVCIFSGVWLVVRSRSEKVYCVFRCLVSNVEVKVDKLTTKLTVK